MFEKYYGICNVLGDKDFNLLIEYKYVLKKDREYYSSWACTALGFDPDQYTEVIIGKDIVTGTPVFSMLPSKRDKVSSLEDAAEFKAIKKGKLIVVKNKVIRIDEMSNYLNKMTDEEANKYIMKVNELKEMYSKAMFRAKHRSSDCRADEKLQKENLEVEKSRVKKLVKTINR